MDQMKLETEKRKVSMLRNKLNKEMNMDYKSAGVDIEAGYKAVELMK